jgi:uncharacterized protein
VRAKTSMASAALEPHGARARAFEVRAGEYLDLALRTSASSVSPRLIAIGGRSGAGKSTLAMHLAPLVGSAPGAVVLRSDVLRKVLRHHEPDERLGADAYTASVTEAVYHALGVRARDLLSTGTPVIVDATFLSPESRDAIRDVATRTGVPFTGLWLEAPPEVMAARLRARVQDASDATTEVLMDQLARDPGPVTWQVLDALAPVQEVAKAAGS